MARAEGGVPTRRLLRAELHRPLDRRSRRATAPDFWTQPSEPTVVLQLVGLLRGMVGWVRRARYRRWLRRMATRPPARPSPDAAGMTVIEAAGFGGNEAPRPISAPRR